MKQEMSDLFTVCQSNSAVHQRNSILLKKLYDNSNHEEFWSNLKNIITLILKSDRGSQYIEKTIKFIGIFCCLLKPKQTEELSEDFEEHILLLEIISYLLKTSEVSDDNVRIRSCQIINVILDNLVGVEISEELCEKLEDVLLKRFQDTKSAVRQHAVITLHRLQNPANPDDVIISELIHLMNSDCYPKVRQLCVEKIAARRDVVCHILMRTRDVDPNVRLAAFKRLSKFAGFLKISEKRLVLHSGFLDKSENVKEYISSGLIKAWLEFYENNILIFMKSIRLDADEKDIENTVELFENVLKVIFRTTSPEILSSTLILDEKKLVPYDKLNWEMVSFWRMYVQYLSKRNDFEEELEKIIPELIYFCNYIKKFYTEMPKEVTVDEFLEQQFILKQLFLITTTYDFGDVTARNCLNNLVTNILKDVIFISDVIETVIGALEYSIPNIEQRTQYVCELISEIECPMDSDEVERKQQEHQFKISKLTVEITKTMHEQEIAINNQNFVEAENLKQKLIKLDADLTNLKNINLEPAQQIEKKTDVATIIKCLDIAAAVLKCPKLDKLTPCLKSLKEDFIQGLLIDNNDNVHTKALNCYGLCCIIDKDTAMSGIHIFSTAIFAYQNGDECDTQTLLVCISAVVDVLRIYGTQLMAAPENGELSESMEERQQAVFAGGTALTDVLRGLVDLMDDDQYDIQERAGLGLCQLVLSGRIISPSLLSRLVLKWCNPATDECVRLKQIIGFALQKVPLLSDWTDVLIDAILLTINALYSAPRTSPLADVNVENIAKFLLALCKISNKVDYLHSTIAVRLVKEMTEYPKSKMNTIYSKILLMLDIPNGKTRIDELLDNCYNLVQILPEKSSVKNLTKLTDKLLLKTRESSSKNDVEKTQNDTEMPDETVAEENGGVMPEICSLAYDRIEEEV
ncbi:unnamed protein product [Psylliodes chrysocephalus]|uniref:Nuclear condensin complex subunit 3 C-terminal domain-containing protein n=1 Tax=Psylliodes chrysocephalus TaxID=3402493 RepID=A0A9P0GKX2_9CUCU|nr:unnamed protein product [Psylliodes chrysocephala]